MPRRYVDELKTEASRRTLTIPSFLAQLLGEHLGADDVLAAIFLALDDALRMRIKIVAGFQVGTQEQNETGVGVIGLSMKLDKAHPAPTSLFRDKLGAL